MAEQQRSDFKKWLEKVVWLLSGLPWIEIVGDVWKIGRQMLQASSNAGLYEVLKYESTLELKDRDGKRATFKKREKVRYLQDSIIAYQDQAWGDGEILVNYRCTPGTPVDRYRSGHKTYTRPVPGDTDATGSAPERGWSSAMATIRSFTTQTHPSFGTSR